jgi:hypothetical protein
MFKKNLLIFWVRNPEFFSYSAPPPLPIILFLFATLSAGMAGINDNGNGLLLFSHMYVW